MSTLCIMTALCLSTQQFEQSLPKTEMACHFNKSRCSHTQTVSVSNGSAARYDLVLQPSIQFCFSTLAQMAPFWLSFRIPSSHQLLRSRCRPVRPCLCSMNTTIAMSITIFALTSRREAPRHRVRRRPRGERRLSFCVVIMVMTGR